MLMGALSLVMDVWWGILTCAGRLRCRGHDGDEEHDARTLEPTQHQGKTTRRMYSGTTLMALARRITLDDNASHQA
jgi:hypothetical protein